MSAPSTSKFSLEVTVVNPHGLHMRSAGKLAQITSQFQSEVFITKGHHIANAKSMLDLLSLSASPKTVLTVTAEGPDAEKAIASIQLFFQSDRDER